MSETADRTEAVFTAAVDLKTPAERAAYLDQACAENPALRARIDALLRAHDRAGHLLDRPPAAELDRTGAYVPPVPIGTVIAGRYKLLEVIGEGGMGSVFVAEQTEPVRRKVAVKLIKPGMDSKSVLARFEAERQALALMDHPNIAKVLDGGLTDAGRPFFVMEYVKGVPITDYCDSTRLSVKDRLGLFVQVCQAVQHAHQKGIIHRDLKPSNILVAPYDGKPVPKVIDFGLAKAMHQSLTDKTLHTAHEAVLGTPIYMSPEQAQLNNLDVDTRSDIYSLGVLLYELLTGTTPLEKRRLKEAAWDEVRRIIREEEPPRPSTRLSSIDTLPSLAACRHTEPASLTKEVRGELDWIVMKALEKDRGRRYETATGFASDLERYLAGEAVLAVPPSAGYRLKKFARKNRPALMTAALVALLLLVAAAVSGWQAVRASDARDLAVEKRNEAEAERDRAERARQAEEAAKNRAVEAQAAAEARRREAEHAREVTTQQRRLALDTVRDVLFRVDELMKNDVRFAPLRIEIVRRMLEDVDRIRDHALKNPLEERTEALAFIRLGEIYFGANRIVDAKQWFDKAHAAVEKLARETPEDPNVLRSLAKVTHDLANVEFRLGNGARSRELHAHALQLCRKRLVLHQTVANADEMLVTDAQYDVADSLQLVAYDDLRLGDPRAAIENYTAAEKTFADLPPPHPQLLKTRRIRNEMAVRLADAHARLGRLDEAEKLFRESLADREALAERAPRPADAALLVREDVGQGRMYLGDFLFFFRKDRAAAAAEYAICLDLFTTLLKTDPDHLSLRQRLAATHYRLGFTASNPAKAKEAFAECLKMRHELARIDSRDTLAGVELALALARVGDRAEAERVAQSLLKQVGTDRQVLFQVACTYAVLAGNAPDRASTDRCRAEAFQVLRDVIAAGWKDAAALETDPDFDAIRADPRFRDLVAKVKPKP
jgi:serine/threonine protein kinase